MLLFVVVPEHWIQYTASRVARRPVARRATLERGGCGPSQAKAPVLGPRGGVRGPRVKEHSGKSNRMTYKWATQQERKEGFGVQPPLKSEFVGHGSFCLDVMFFCLKHAFEINETF